MNAKDVDLVSVPLLLVGSAVHAEMVLSIEAGISDGHYPSSVWDEPRDILQAEEKLAIETMARRFAVDPELLSKALQAYKQDEEIVYY